MGPVARTFGATVVRLRLLLLPVAVALGVWLGMHADLATNDQGGLIRLIPSGSPATVAQQRAGTMFSVPFAADAVVVEHDGDGLATAEQQAVYQQALANDRGAHSGAGPAMLAIPITNTQGATPGSTGSSTTALTYLAFPADTPLAQRVSMANAYAAQAANRRGAAVVGVTGAQPADLHQGRLIDNALDRVEIATVVLILVVVGLLFRSLLAPAAVIGLAALAYLAGLALQAELARRFGLQKPDSLRPLMIALVLGIVTDYCIFYLSAAREQLRAGETRLAAARHVGSEITPIVVVSGLILAAGLCMLRVSSVGFFRDLGPSLAVAVVAAVVASILLMPALVGVFGSALFWPRRLVSPPAEPRPRRFMRIAVRKPVALTVALLCVAGLLVGADVAGRLRLGLTPIRGLPQSAVERRAADAAAQGFAPGMIAPTQVIVAQTGVSGRTSQVDQLEQELHDQPGVAAVVGPAALPPLLGDDPMVAKDGSAVRFLIAFTSDPHGASAIDRLSGLEQAMPDLLQRAGLGGARASYAGDTPLAQETVNALTDDALRIAVAVILVNLVLLMLFLRAVIGPVLLVGASLLAVAAAVGISTWVLQDWLGHETVTAFVPFIAAVLLVSLGSDYNVFVTGRVWQEARRRPLPDAVAVAAPRASRALRTAGITLAGSFGLLVLVPILAFREFALMMAVGVLLETLLVRSLLVPALIAGFGYVATWPGRRIRIGQARPGHSRVGQRHRP